MIRELASAIAASYRLAFSLFAGAVGLWLGAALFELLQHAVEWELGMFTRGDGIEAGFETQTRMTFGYLKAAALVVCFYLVPRFIYQDRKWRRVLSYDNALLKGVAVAAGTAGLSMAPSAGLTALAARIDLMDPALEFAWAQLIGFLLTIPLAALLPWSIGLIAGDNAMTFRKSVASMHRRWLWAFFLTLACMVPAIVPHYLLNDLAYGMPPAVVGLLLLLDSILVGFIALLFGSAYWTIYRFRVLDKQADTRVESRVR